MPLDFCIPSSILVFSGVMYRLRIFLELLLLDVVVVSSIAQRLEDNNFAVATSHLRKKTSTEHISFLVSKETKVATNSTYHRNVK